jgi:hypothetical protein
MQGEETHNRIVANIKLGKIRNNIPAAFAFLQIRS